MTQRMNPPKSLNVNPTAAIAKLETIWNTSSIIKLRLPEEIENKIHAIIKGSTLTYRYILITGILAKIVNPKVHPRALQKGSKLDGAYDARSLCHSVVVPFEHSKGNLWGLSNEPFVNKPARHPQHDKNNPQLRDRRGASITHDVLEWAHYANSDDLIQALSLIMQLGKEQLALTPKALKVAERNLSKVRRFTLQFLQVSDGGARLVSVLAAFIQLLNPKGSIKVYSPNTPDKFRKTAGDIEFYIEDKLLSVYECKDRPFNDNDIIHGLEKAAKCQPEEYIFISGLNSQPPPTNPEKLGEKYGIDTCWTSIGSILDGWTLALNPKRRSLFGENVIKQLEEMRHRESSKAAEELWNEIMKE